MGLVRKALALAGLRKFWELPKSELLFRPFLIRYMAQERPVDELKPPGFMLALL